MNRLILSSESCSALRWGLLLGLICSLGISGCEGPKPSRISSRPGLHKVEIGSQVIWCEMAADPTRRRNGLMHRVSMPEDVGMLFVFPGASLQGFWMKNCKMSLDIAYIDDQGLIIDILKMDAPRPGQVYFPRYRSSQPVRYALETNVGWFEKHGIQVGSRVTGFRGPPALTAR